LTQPTKLRVGCRNLY